MSKLLSLNIYTAWLDFRHAFRTFPLPLPTRRQTHLFGHLSRGAKTERSFNIFMTQNVISIYGQLIRPGSLFAKGLRLTNDCNLCCKNTKAYQIRGR